MPGEPLRAISASARIYQWLRDRIAGGEMPPGLPVSEKGLAEGYGVSRTPVREALLRLADERLIDIFPQRGTFVSRISVESLRDGMVIREALERVAVRHAADKVTDADIGELRLVLERQQASERAGDWAGFHAEDEEFHRRIAILSGHPNLWRVVRQEKVQVDRCRVLHLPISGRRERVIAEHRAILAALAARDAEAADRAMAEHLGNVLPGLDELLRARPEYFEFDAALRAVRRSEGPQ
ncbi:MAG TPA: GntR family transcriptional regulator [Roseiarcus sp.]|jgi:DNA-binding GntR family transcriptional regulator